jgi:predicted 3-demethylubiquinone-9 3-methyltransferase (glyoxalase superfamily)
MVECEDQAEIDRLWSALSAVPEAEQCGWLKDEFGVSWQIVPKDFLQYVNAQSAPIIYSMKKFDIAQMKKAAGL